MNLKPFRDPRIFIAAGLTVVVSAALTGCGPDTSSQSSGSSKAITIGSANFTESEIVADIYAAALESNGYSVTKKLSIGSREAYIPALKDGSIDLIPDYTGNLLAYLDEDATETSPADVAAALPAPLAKSGIEMYTPAAGEDKDSITVTKETAEKWDLTSIADLVPHQDQVIIGANAEFKTLVGLPGLKKNYGLVPGKFVTISDGGGPKTVASLKNGTINAADIYTTSPSIRENGLVTLTDPKNNFAAQNVVPVITKSKSTPAIKKILDQVSAKLTTDELIALNEEVSGPNKTSASKAASDWVTANISAK